MNVTYPSWEIIQQSYSASTIKSWRQTCEDLRIPLSVVKRGIRKELLYTLKQCDIERLCENCNKVIKSRKATKYCSHECSVIFQVKKYEVKIKEGSAGIAAVKRYLLRNGAFCEECNQNELWNNKKLTLHVDHKNGNSDDNRLENLRLLCPNCHSQTDNFGIKNKGQRSKRNLYMKKMREDK